MVLYDENGELNLISSFIRTVGSCIFPDTASIVTKNNEQKRNMSETDFSSTFLGENPSDRSGIQFYTTPDGLRVPKHMVLR